MRVPFNLKYDKEEHKGTIPQEWSDVPFSDYVEYCKCVGKEGIERIYEIFTRIPAEVWKKPHDASLFANIDKVLAFTSVQPTTSLPTHLETSKGIYDIDDDFMNLPLSKYRDMIEIINSINTKEEYEDWEQIAIIPKVISVLACKEYKSIKDIEETAKEIEGMPTDEVMAIGGFFLSKLQRLKIGIEKEPLSVRYLVNKFKLVTSKFLAILVICIHFIIYPKEILRSLKRFCRLVYLKCTGGSSYKVVSTNPIIDIKK